MQTKQCWSWSLAIAGVIAVVAMWPNGAASVRPPALSAPRSPRIARTARPTLIEPRPARSPDPTPDPFRDPGPDLVSPPAPTPVPTQFASEPTPGPQARLAHAASLLRAARADGLDEEVERLERVIRQAEVASQPAGAR